MYNDVTLKNDIKIQISLHYKLTWSAINVISNPTFLKYTLFPSKKDYDCITRSIIVLYLYTL
jgi:hypothetical protein